MPLPATAPDELRTARGLRLRAVQASDAPLDFALSRDADVLAGTSFPPRLSEKAAQERVARAVMRRAAAEAARCLAQWAAQAGAPQVVLVTYPDNEASQRTARRCGFFPTGSSVERRGNTDRRVILWAYQPESTAPPYTSTVP